MFNQKADGTGPEAPPHRCSIKPVVGLTAGTSVESASLNVFGGSICKRIDIA